MLWDMSESCGVCECSSFEEDDFKETMQECLNTSMKRENEENDISLYENSSPVSTCDGSPSHCLHQNKRRRPLEDLDNTSQDSGYEINCLREENKFFSSPKRSFHSHGSFDDFLDICGLEDDNENAQLPGDFNKLISGSLLSNFKKSPCERPVYRQSISLNETTPNSTRVRSCLFKNDDIKSTFKRPEPPTETQSPKNSKRTKIFDMEEMFKPRPLMRSISLPVTEDRIKTALQRSHNEPDLIGDFSKHFCLPLTPGKHSDLKSVTADTFALLVKGHFSHSVSDFKIIDCRFPYEYKGGHILGAVNLYTKEQILDELLKGKIKEYPEGFEHDENEREILIFHCEFSSERGPNLSRFLRQIDRKHNNDVYPYLHYPEIYLLDGGYKNFYKEFPELCHPRSYLPMLHPSFENDLRHFRTKSKTFNSDNRSRNNFRSATMKRL